MTLDTYAHVIAELEGGERRSADELTAIARGADLLSPSPIARGDSGAAPVKVQRLHRDKRRSPLTDSNR